MRREKLTIGEKILAAAAVLMAAGAVYGCGSSGNGNNSGTETAAEGSPVTTSAAGSAANGSGESASTVTTATVTAPAPPPSELSGLPVIPSAVTAEQSFNDDSVTVTFYVQGFGTFTAQEKAGGAWQTTKQNMNYQGSGGLDAGTIPPGGDSITLRLLKIEGGQPVATTKEITVRKVDVVASGGIKTYQN